MRRIRPNLIPGLLLCALTLVGCGDRPDESATQVIHKKESETLKKEGTAANPEEVARRAEEEQEKREKAEALKQLNVYGANLSKAKDSFEIAEALAEIGTVGRHAAGLVDRIEEKYLKHADGDVRVAAYQAYGKIKGIESRRALQEGLGDEAEEVRAAVLEVWREAGITSIGPVVPLLEDLDPDVQYQAMKTINASAPDVKTVLEVIRLMPGLDGPAAKEALHLLKEKKDVVPDLDGTLIGMMDHPDQRVRLEAVRVAAQVEAKRYAVARKLVSNLGDDPDRNVRRESWETLKAWAGGGAPEYDPDTEDDAAREAAAGAWETWLEGRRASFGG